MKTLIIASGIAIVVSVGVFLYPSITEVTNIREYIEVERTVEVNVLENRIKDALEEANGSIESKAQEAYNKVYEMEVKKIEDAVKANYIKEIEATISSEDY